jgi:pimeloyl-ACP methyl ester carboxylesterase
VTSRAARPRPSTRPGGSWIDEGHTATVASGITLDYAAVGDPGDPTVLLIMGLSGQRILWPRELVDALVDGGCHVVAHDNRDVGHSTVLDDAPVDLATLTAAMNGLPFEPAYRLSDMAMDAVGLLDHLEVAQAHVVGVSMGGMIAQHLAFAHADRVTSLTSINSTPGMAPPAEPLTPRVEIPDPTPPTAPDEFVDWFTSGLRELSSQRHFDESETRELARAVHERGVHPDGNLRHLLAILDDGDRTSRLAGITVPTLVLHGAEDPLVPPAAGEATAAAIPGARLRLFQDMAHDVPLALVEDIAAELLAHVTAAERGDERRARGGAGSG